MRVFRHIAVTALATLGIFSAVTYTSCTKSSTPANQQFLGTYSATENCSPATSSGTWASVITASSTGDNGVVISNFDNSGASVSGTVSGNNLTIPSTPVNITGATGTVSGSGTISGNTLTINYVATITLTGGSPQTYTCAMAMVKQ